jgi:hypothetical protein
MRYGSLSWITSSQRERCLDGASLSELGKDGVDIQVEDVSIEDGSILENLGDLHLVRERIDLQFIEKKSLSSINLISFGNNLLGGKDINLGLDNLGLDEQVLEESSLLWVETGWSGWDNDISGGDHTSLGWGWSDFTIEDFLDISEISVGEDNVDVSLELGDDLFKVLVLLESVFSGLIIGISNFWGSVESGERSLHKSVFTHDHDGSDFSELGSDHADLLRRNVVSVDEQGVLVCRGDVLESEPVVLLLDSSFCLLCLWHFVTG